MGLFKKAPQKGASTKTAGKVEVMDTKLHVNPSPKNSLARKKGRLASIEASLAKGTIKEYKRAFLEKRKRILEMEIKIAEGGDI